MLPSLLQPPGAPLALRVLLFKDPLTRVCLCSATVPTVHSQQRNDWRRVGVRQVGGVDVSGFAKSRDVGLNYHALSVSLAPFMWLATGVHRSKSIKRRAIFG